MQLINYSSYIKEFIRKDNVDRICIIKEILKKI